MLLFFESGWFFHSLSGDERYPKGDGIEALGLRELAQELAQELAALGA